VRGAKVLLVAVAAVVLAGCGGTVDTAKQTFPRSTVPAGQGGDEPGSSTGRPRSNDPAFSNDELRKLDPCALLSDDLLAALGKPAENNSQDFGTCANYMEDKDGKELNITLYVGETISGAEGADENIGGLPAFESELDDHSACFVSVITSTNPNFGIRAQVGGKSKDLCAAGTTIVTGVVDTIRTEPLERAAKRGSVSLVDPCALLDEAGLKTALGVETSLSPYSLHWCNWIGDNVNAGVWFRTGYDPKDSTVDPGTPVDLGGGVTGYQSTGAGGSASCRLAWRHRSTGADGADEIVEVNVDKARPPAGDNGCAAAVAVAKLLIPALPKP
jgi:uncharacterized protein DUF3558